MTSEFMVPDARDSLKLCCIQAAIGRWENIRQDSSITTMRRALFAPRADCNQAATQVMTTGRAGEWYTALRSTADEWGGEVDAGGGGA
jgi:hypothetical protein